MVKPPCSKFRVVTANFSGVQIFFYFYGILFNFLPVGDGFGVLSTEKESKLSQPYESKYTAKVLKIKFADNDSHLMWQSIQILASQ